MIGYWISDPFDNLLIFSFDYNFNWPYSFSHRVGSSCGRYILSTPIVLGKKLLYHSEILLFWGKVNFFEQPQKTKHTEEKYYDHNSFAFWRQLYTMVFLVELRVVFMDVTWVTLLTHLVFLKGFCLEIIKFFIKLKVKYWI